MTCVLPTGTGPACAVASVPMPRPVRSLASLSRTGGHKPAAVSDALVGAGSTCGRQGTPDICSALLVVWPGADHAGGWGTLDSDSPKWP